MNTIERVSKIKGFNLGSWLLMEGYILGGRNIPERSFKQKFIKANGRKELEKFEVLFRDNFINQNDFKRIALLGANTLRLPFNYRLFEKKSYCSHQAGFFYLDKAFSWAKKYNLGIILDMHACPGAQNCDWHADSIGKAMLWESSKMQNQTVQIWETIVDRYKGNKNLVGYDLLNEPVLGNKSIQVLKVLYKRLIKAVRSIDKKNLIFLEGDLWAQRVDFLADLIEDNLAISIHTYSPLDFVFNFSPFLKFPGKIEGTQWSQKHINKYLDPYYKFSKKHKVGIFVGEFGINWRGGFWGEGNWLEAMLKAFADYKFGFTYWTFKAVAQYIFPDGLFQQINDSKYINRPGPVIGWETYPEYWKKEKNKIVEFWNTKNYTPNSKLIKILRRYF